VKEYGSKDEYFDNDDGSEDSDCEGGMDQAGRPVPEPEVIDGEESGQDHLSILSIGSFAR